MTKLKLLFAPNPIFKRVAESVDVIDSSIRAIIDTMFEIMYENNAVGIGANMVGILKCIAVVDLQDGGRKELYTFINPKITFFSPEMQTFTEGSLCYPGITAEITRPKQITLDYLDYDGNQQTLEASGWLATVIQHELDYLNGKVFLDYLSPLKRNILLKKMQKSMRNK